MTMCSPLQLAWQSSCCFMPAVAMVSAGAVLQCSLAPSVLGVSWVEKAAIPLIFPVGGGIHPAVIHQCHSQHSPDSKEDSCLGLVTVYQCERRYSQAASSQESQLYDLRRVCEESKYLQESLSDRSWQKGRLYQLNVKIDYVSCPQSTSHFAASHLSRDSTPSTISSYPKCENQTWSLTISENNSTFWEVLVGTVECVCPPRQSQPEPCLRAPDLWFFHLRLAVVKQYPLALSHFSCQFQYSLVQIFLRTLLIL